MTERVLMSVKDYAKHIGIGESYLRRKIIKMEGFPAVAVGRNVKIVAADADEYIKSNLRK